MLLPVLVSGRGPDVETRTGTSYWLLLLWSLLLRVWIDWCDDWLVRPSQYATRLLCGSTMHTCITMYVGRRRSARSYCVRAHAPGLEQTDDYHRRPCKLCVNWMPEYSDCRSPYSDMHMGPITGLALPLMLGSTAILICITSADYVKA